MEIHAIGMIWVRHCFIWSLWMQMAAWWLRKRCSRTQLLTYTANVRVRVIGMEPAAEPIFSGALCGAGPRGAADSGAVREALREDEQERLH